MTQEREPIPLGSMVPLTGPSAIDGAEFRNGVTFACEDINARGGVLGRPLRPIFIDTGRQSAEEVVGAASRLIDEHGVHAIINGYNHGPQNSEYEPIADAGIIYIHHNTLIQHHDTVQSDPERYFGCFMGNPADYWYGQGLMKFLSSLRSSGRWTPANNRIAIISGSRPYSVVIANAMAAAASSFGWTVSFGPEVVSTPRTDWRDIIRRATEDDPSVIANTHYFASDVAAFQKQFMERPSNSLIYLPWGAMHQSFHEIAGDDAIGVIVSAVTGLLRDEVGNQFARRYAVRFGPSATPHVGCQVYNAVRHYAIAAAIAGGTAGPGGYVQNRKLAGTLIETAYRGVSGTLKYHPTWQAAVGYPDLVHDPSLGMPHLFYQIQDTYGDLALIAPQPYDADSFMLPPWCSR